MSQRRDRAHPPVPTAVALAYDRRGWHLIPAPPSWWLLEQEALVELDALDDVGTQRLPD